MLKSVHEKGHCLGWASITKGHAGLFSSTITIEAVIAIAALIYIYIYIYIHTYMYLWRPPDLALLQVLREQPEASIIMLIIIITISIIVIIIYRNVIPTIYQ